MIMMYKILQGLDGIPFNDLFSYHHTVTRSNGYKLLVYKNFCHLSCRPKHFFSQRGDISTFIFSFLFSFLF